MSNISMVEAKLPPGFRFHPRDEELVCDYLMKKVTHCDPPLMIDVDLNKCEPWDIPETACVGGKEWYFYTQRDRKYATGLRTNRATASGYWKATGKDRPILRKGSLVGMRKTLVFYQGRAPKGKKTDWVMHEFRLEPPLPPSKTSFTPKEDWVLCRVFYKNREEIVKANMGSCYDDTGSSSLPELMDSYISFDQPAPHHHQYEQVPCFSTLFSHHHHHQAQTTNPHNNNNNNNNNTIVMDQQNLLGAPKSTNTATAITYGGGTVLPNHLGSSNSDSTSNYLDPFSCDRKVLKAVLTQLTKMEPQKGSPSFADHQRSHHHSEAYLSQVPIPNLWNNY